MHDIGRVETEELGDALFLELVDEIDISNVAHIRYALARAALTSKPRIVVSLERASFVDVRGIDMLIEFFSWVKDKSVALIVGPNPTVRKLVDLTQLADVAYVVQGQDELKDAWLWGRP